jgi:hypothetical protein
MKHEGKKALGRHNYRLEHNIEKDTKELLFADAEWIQLAHDSDL